MHGSKFRGALGYERRFHEDIRHPVADPSRSHHAAIIAGLCRQSSLAMHNAQLSSVKHSKFDFAARSLSIGLVFSVKGHDRMADYYSVLARAVVNLETEDSAAREELYERARSIIVAELRKQNPKISALTITREQAALEAAIRRLEAELRSPARDNNRKTSPQDRSNVAEADYLGEMPKALAAIAVRHRLSGGGHRLQRRRLLARSGARQRRHYPISHPARRYGGSRLFISPVVPHGISEAPRLQPQRRSRPMTQLSGHAGRRVRALSDSSCSTDSLLPFN